MSLSRCPVFPCKEQTIISLYGPFGMTGSISPAIISPTQVWTSEP